MASHGYPPDLHGGLSDTAEMMYLDTDDTWVRKALVKTALGDPVSHRGVAGTAAEGAAAVPGFGQKHLRRRQ
jgi:hypothetical protein